MKIQKEKSAAAKKEQLVEEMLIANYSKYYRLAYSYVRNEADAQDIVQEGAYKAILNSDSLREPSYADTWIYRIIVNEAIAFLRKNRKETVNIEDIPEAVTDTYQDLDLRQAMEALEPLDRTIIVLRYFEEMKLDQIAEITKTNLNTVKSRLYRTLKKLHLALEPEITQA